MKPEEKLAFRYDIPTREAVRILGACKNNLWAAEEGLVSARLCGEPERAPEHAKVLGDTWAGELALLAQRWSELRSEVWRVIRGGFEKFRSLVDFP